MAMNKTQTEAAVHDLPVRYLQCRDIRHQWQITSKFQEYYWYDEDEKRRETTLLQRTLTCARCGTKRHDVYNSRSFERESTRYEYPKKYILPGNKVRGGMGQIIRAESYKRGL